MKMKPNLSFGLLFVLMGLSVQAQKYDLAACLRMAETTEGKTNAWPEIMPYSLIPEGF